VKLHWTDWPTNHSAPARLHELVAMANRCGVYRVVIRPVDRILDSSDTVVLPASAPRNQLRVAVGINQVYIEEKHGPKPHVVFDRPVYRSFEILLLTGEGTAELGEDPTGRGCPEIAWQPTPGHAPAWWADQLAKGIGERPRVVELPDGRVVVIEAGTTRALATPLLARAVVQTFGSEPVSTEAAAAYPAGPPVTSLKVPGRTAFVVIGGRRHDLPRIPATMVVDPAVADRFEVGPPLDLLRAAESMQQDRRRPPR